MHWNGSNLSLQEEMEWKPELQFSYTINLIQNVKHAYSNFKEAIWG